MPKQVKHLRSGDILVEVDKEHHYRNIMKTSMLVNIPFKVSPIRTLNTIKDVIRCNELRSTPQEDIIVILPDQVVCEAHKLVITNKGKKITTGTIVLTFHGSVIPPQIIVGYLKVKVFSYVPNP